MKKRKPKRGTLTITFGSYGVASGLGRHRTALRIRNCAAEHGVSITELAPGDLCAFSPNENKSYADMVAAGEIAILVPVTKVSVN